MSDFYRRQMEFQENSNDIVEVETDDLLVGILNRHLEKNQSEGVDSGLVNFIKARGDKEKVINYITYVVNNNPNNLSYDDLFQLSELKIALVKDNLNKLQDSIDKPRNIDFEIVGGTITVKTFGIKHEGGLKFSKEKTRDIAYDIVNEKIINLGNHKYKVLLKREGSSRTYKFEIKYNGGNSITVYDQYGRYIGRQVVETKQKTIIKGNKYRKEIYQTPGSFTIDTQDEKIKLNIMFNK